MTGNPFWPPSPLNSFNRVRVVDLPGLALDPDVRGATAYDLLSAPALETLIRTHAASLNLDPTATDLPRQLDASFDSPEAGVRAAAEAVGRVFGRRLGTVLLALHRGDAVNRAARAEWVEAHWDWWGQVRHVWLGGGLASGNLGRPIARYAGDLLAENGCPALTVRPSPHGHLLPLIGAARHLPPQETAAIALDFGHSAVKRACIHYNGGMITGLTRLPDIPATWTADAAMTLDFAHRLIGLLAAVVAETWTVTAAIAPGLSTAITASMATYLQDGHPLPAMRGCYAALGLLPDRAAHVLAAQVGAQGIPRAQVTLVHDATAAASVMAGRANTVVLTMGTAVGVGWPPPGELTPLAETLER